MKLKLIFLIVLIIVLGLIYYASQFNQNKNTVINSNQPVINQPAVEKTPAQPVVPTTTDFMAPISRANERVTKKPFGIKISPATSPIQPERFSGYHTGTDFETFPQEADTTVVINSICDGKVIYRQRVSGYGGVLIQSCEWQGQPITVLYGHLALSSIDLKIGDDLKAKQSIGDLGQGYSYDTDGERKHLHLGIHKNSAINLKGYVQDQSQLGEWIDWTTLIKSGS